MIVGLAVYIHFNQTSSKTTTLSSSTVSVTSLSPTTFVATTLGFNDFYIANIIGCTYTNQTTGQTFAEYSLQIANRLNEPVHYLNGSTSAAFILSNGTLPKKIFSPQVVGPTQYAQVINLEIIVPIAGGGFGNAEVLYVQGFLTLYFKELKTGPAMISLLLSISSISSSC